MSTESKENIATPRMLFEAHFDDLKRSMQSKGVTLNKLITCFRGTPEYEAWMGAFINPENKTIHYTADEKDNVYTFYTILAAKVAEVPSKESE